MSDVSDYEEYWRTVYQETYASGKEFWRPELATPREFIEFLDSPQAPVPPARVLEAGCSDGLNCVYLRRKGYTVTGVDISAEAVKRAEQLARSERVDIEFLCMDLAAERLERPEAYDWWVDIKTLHCLWEDEARQAYLHNAFDSLEPGGILFLNCALALADVRDHFPDFFRTLDPAIQRDADTLDRTLPREGRSGIRCETLDWYCQECETAGFEIEHSERVVGKDSGWGVVIVARKPSDSAVE